MIIATPLTMTCSMMPPDLRLTSTCFQKLFAQYEDIYLSRPYNQSMEREADRASLGQSFYILIWYNV